MLAIPIKTIERLSLYRRILKGQRDKGVEYIFSHNLAELAGGKPAQVRRDLSYLEQVISTSRGYRIKDLLAQISGILYTGEVQKMVIVGIGHMGKALINFFKGHGKNLEIAAAFDTDPAKIGRVINGCRCYHLDELPAVVRQQDIAIGTIAVPESAAREVCSLMELSGIKAIINIAPVPLKGSHEIFIENLDLTTFFEKAAYHAHSKLKEKNE